jgi:hypothetical protein
LLRPKQKARHCCRAFPSLDQAREKQAAATIPEIAELPNLQLSRVRLLVSKSELSRAWSKLRQTTHKTAPKRAAFARAVLPSQDGLLCLFRCPAFVTALALEHVEGSAGHRLKHAGGDHGQIVSKSFG